MSSETEKVRLCAKCNAAVRPGALFCYHCGAQVAADEGKPDVSDAWFKESIVESPKGSEEKQKLKEEAIAEAEEFGGSGPGRVKDLIEKEEAAEASLPKLKTAATMRGRAKSLQKRVVEVKWEAPESAPNGWFLGAVVLLSLIALAVFIAASIIR